MKLLAPKQTAFTYSTKVTLDDGKAVTVHMARYEKRNVRARIVQFETPTRLLDWCEREAVSGAITGGFFLRETAELLGDVFVGGEKVQTVPFAKPWDRRRGSIEINGGTIQIAHRFQLSAKPTGDLMQAGPLLVRDSRNLVRSIPDGEGFSRHSHQFDSDITVGRYPRAAIGINNRYVMTVACDGRASGEAGLTMEELADVMIGLGAKDALNLDGGSSASLVNENKLLNVPRSNTYRYPRGRRIFSAIAFETV